MLRQRGWWLLCRRQRPLNNAWLVRVQTFSIAQLIRHRDPNGIRPWPKHPKVRPNGHQFIASSLLLDFDAEPNKYVRPFDPAIDGEPERPTATRIQARADVKAGVNQFETEFARDEENFRKVTENPLSIWRINSLDILSKVLKAPWDPQRFTAISKRDRVLPATISAQNSADFTPSLLDWNAIPRDVLQDTSRAIPYILRRQEVASSNSLLREDLKFLVETVHDCSNLSELSRLIQQIFTTPDGSKLVSRLSGTIGMTCNRIISTLGSELATDGLAFLDDLPTLTKALNHILGEVGAIRALWHFARSLRRGNTLNKNAFCDVGFVAAFERLRLNCSSSNRSILGSIYTAGNLEDDLQLNKSDIMSKAAWTLKSNPAASTETAAQRHPYYQMKDNPVLPGTLYTGPNEMNIHPDIRQIIVKGFQKESMQEAIKLWWEVLLHR
ncbi:hypothetical protein BX600DRAFT_547383 [Xylariales sp. PMI_506]|nr:hypothetical protein BX600DRAFT_547383 [Xylariales sp. PMI_506]